MLDESPRVTAPRALVVFQLILAMLTSWKGLRAVGAILLALATRTITFRELRDGLREALPIVLDDSRWREHCRIHVLKALYGYVRDHADAVGNIGGHHTYSDGFRLFVRSLVGPGQLGGELSPEELASVIGVPLGTLEEWLGSK